LGVPKYCDPGVFGVEATQKNQMVGGEEPLDCNWVVTDVGIIVGRKFAYCVLLSNPEPPLTVILKKGRGFLPDRSILAIVAYGTGCCAAMAPLRSKGI
jgi:hypothetical protein